MLVVSELCFHAMLTSASVCVLYLPTDCEPRRALPLCAFIQVIQDLKEIHTDHIHTSHFANQSPFVFATSSFNRRVGENRANEESVRQLRSD